MSTGSSVNASSVLMNRRDHYLPQGYLRGFIDSARWNHKQPLWHFDIPNLVWSEKSPREVGYRLGFYDYTTAQIGLETADKAFAELENTFPKVCRELVSRQFANWKEHRDMLLRYAQMLRARSLLFFSQKRVEGQNLRAWIVEDVSRDRMSVKVKSMTPEPLPDGFIRNWTINQMRDEIKKGAAWLNEFNWALRYCDSPSTPFIVSEFPVLLHGRQSRAEDAFRDPESLLIFPLCWQACLIGSRQYFEIDTDKFGLQDMLRAQKIYRQSAELFILSPTKLDLS
jgi:hypothetical protein